MGVSHDESTYSQSVTSSSKSTTQSRSKVATILISGVGFLADAYDLFVIDFVVAILSATAFTPPTLTDKGVIVSSTLAGAVIGQLFFGIAADFLGRRIMFVSTAFLVVLGSVSSALVGWGYTQHTLGFSIFHQLAICRFILGCGIGGEYPLSATVSSETETKEELYCGSDVKYPSGILWYLSHKPNSIAAVFSMQGVGMLLSPLIVLLCISVGVNMETTWRLCLGIGAVPSAIAFIFRWKMSETVAFQQMKDELCASQSSVTATSLTSAVPPYTTEEKGVSLEKDTNIYCEAFNDKFEDNRVFTQTTDDNHSSDLKTSEAYEQKINSKLPSSNKDTNKNDHKRSLEGHNSFNPYLVEVATSKLNKSMTMDENNRKPFEIRPCAAEPFKSISPHTRSGATKSTFKEFMHHVRKSLNIIRSLKYVIIGTSVTWFLIDVTLYGTGSFKSVIVAKLFSNSEKSTPSINSTSSRRLLIDSLELPESAEMLPFHTIIKSYEPSDIKNGDLNNPRKSISEGTLNNAFSQQVIPNFNQQLYTDTDLETENDNLNDAKKNKDIDNTHGETFLSSARYSNKKRDLDLIRNYEPEIKRPIDFNSIHSANQFQRMLLHRILNKPIPSPDSQLRYLASDETKGANNKNDTTRASVGSLKVDSDEARNTVILQARMGAVVALLAIPGYVLSLLFIHKVGTQQLQFWGFLATALVFIALGAEQLLVRQNFPILELILFGLTFLCSNFGPNTTTFIIPTQVYPTIIRATCHGFSAAMGKLGGVVGTSLFSVIEDFYGLGWLLIMCGIVAIVGALFTFLIPKDLKSKKHSIHKLLELEP